MKSSSRNRRFSVRGEVQEAGRDIAVQQHPGEQERRIGQDEQEAGGQEERDVLEVVEVDPADPVDGLAGLELAGVGRRVERRLPQILGRAVAGPRSGRRTARNTSA